MEITVREIISSIVIIAVMLIIGFTIDDKITASSYARLEQYSTALKIKDNPELFQYSKDTSVGDILIEGNMTPVDTVGFPDIVGEFITIEQIEEEYVKKTRTVTYTVQVNGKSQTRTRLETYWEWDVVKRESKESNQVMFCGQKYNTEDFELPSRQSLGNVDIGYHRRYRYSGIKAMSYPLTIFVNMNIEGENILEYYYDATIDSIVNMIEHDTSSIVIVFWIVWIIMIGGIVCVYYHAENNWLE